MKLRNGFAYAPLREDLNDVLKLCIALSDVLVDVRRLHADVLELLERQAGVQGLVLAGVADQQRAIVWTHSLEEFAGLLRADEAGFVNDVEVSPIRGNSGLSQVRL